MCAVGNNLITGEGADPGLGQDMALATVLEGLYHLHRMDEQKLAGNKRYWVPELEQAPLAENGK